MYNSSSLRRLWTGLVMGVLALTIVPAARAMGPDIVETQLKVVEVIGCSGYNVVAEWDVTRRVTTFYDSDGNPIRVHRHIQFEGTLTNSVTGKSLLDKGTFTLTSDLASGTLVVTGAQRHTIEHGRGIVIQGTGRQILVPGDLVFEAGKWYTDEDFCPALG
jgi:hypothetical protein